MLSLLFGFSLGMTALPARADLHFVSGPARTSLLDLYTSEGCSSCPPAEAQLSQLKSDPDLWKKFVPLAFHVDYWDRLGWRDRFSAKEWTARQSRYATLWQSESVYSPAFVLNGSELRGGLGSASWPNDAAGTLSATSKDGKTWSIEFHPATPEPGQWEAHLALLGAGISSKIGAGENSGRKLDHDFVVLGLQDTPLVSGEARLTIAPAHEDAPRKALAVWITRRGELAPVQVTGGWLAAR
ncbi:MAG TPA: DUF1223 domain-containing protein [Chthoniobacterales bacterium]